MKVAVQQSNYLPWRGYFDIIQRANVFVFYDDVKYSKNTWRNRNRIRTAQGTVWLTVPVSYREGDRICDVRIAGESWRKKHRETVYQNIDFDPKTYDMWVAIDAWYDLPWKSLSALNQYTIRRIAEWCKIKTVILDSRDFKLHGNRTARLIDLIKQVGGDTYITGPKGLDYFCENDFTKEGIALEIMQYNYREYPQRFDGWDGNVTVLDTIFNTGGLTL